MRGYILMSKPMVLATLGDLKSKTRRLSGLEMVNKNPDEWKHSHMGTLRTTGHKDSGKFGAIFNKQGFSYFVPFPYDQVLWVRETMIADYETSDSVVLSKYAADGAPVLYPGPEKVDEDGEPDYGGSIAHWDYSRDIRPSIHMTRAASRLTLELTDRRAERLHDISEKDAGAEGLNIFNEDDANLYYSHLSDDTWPDGWHLNSIDAFKALWESINGEGSWDANPWVWVLGFKAHKMNISQFKKQAAA